MLITISRQVATNGELIGRLVATQLGVRYLDRELLDELARRMDVEPKVAYQFDETTLNPVQSILWEWLSNINEAVYLHALTQAFRHIQQEGNIVVIGRGGNFLLHGPDCLHVRIVAPLALRVEIYRAEHGVSAHEAERLIRQGDEGRSRFIQRLFHHNVDDPTQYDLMLNLVGLTPEMATEIIVNAAQVRAAHRVGTATSATLPHHVQLMTRHRQPAKPSIFEPEEYRKSA